MPSQPTLNELLHAASRTFALGIDLLPEPLRSEVETAYLVLRVSDYLEDNPSMAPERKAPLLEHWAGVLAGSADVADFERDLGALDDDSPDALVARHAARVHAALMGLPARARGTIATHTRDSTLGMARWVRRGPDFPDESALDDYMHEVAGRVGWLLTDLFAETVPRVAARRDRMRDLGREFGLALQTVNVIRGLHADWERGWVFVPRTFVPPEAEPVAALLEGSLHAPEAERAMLARLVAKAEGHLDAGQAYLAGIPRRAHAIRLFCLLPYFFAVRTLAISRDNPRVFREETKITRPEVRSIVRWSRLLGWCQPWVGWYRRRLSAPGRPQPNSSPASARP